LTFLPEHEPERNQKLTLLITALASQPTPERPLLISKINGQEASRSEFAVPLRDAGFESLARGLRLKA
jgi:hypothetical protein